jgi:hypothetical protein
MELVDAETQVRVLGAQLHEAAATMDRAQRTVTGIGKILDGYIEMFPQLQSVVDEATAGITLPTTEAGDDGRPRGAEAVRLILQESPSAWFRVSQLVGLLRDRGWLPESENPANAVRTALERLVADPDDSDVVRGKFKSGAVGYMYDPDRDRTPPAGGYGFDEEPF